MISSSLRSSISVGESQVGEVEPGRWWEKLEVEAWRCSAGGVMTGGEVAGEAAEVAVEEALPLSTSLLTGSQSWWSM